MSLFSSCTFCVLNNQFNFYHHYLFHPRKYFFTNNNQYNYITLDDLWQQNHQYFVTMNNQSI